jgi:uncharacterized protein (TIGR03437 family)
MWRRQTKFFFGRMGGIFILLLAAGMPALAQTCTSITILTPPAMAPAGGGTGTVSFTALPAGCTRTAASNAPWITITFGATGTGDGTVGWAVPANPTLDPRSGTISIGSQPYTITQNGGTCSFSISPSSATISPNGGTSSFSVIATAGCSWTAVSSAPWVTVNTPSGTGSSSVSYQVQPNPSPAVRTASITVGTQTFTVVQSAACSLTLTPPSVSVPAAGSTGTVNVTASASGCDRAASSTSPWISISFGATGTGNGQFGYTVAPNTTGQARTGTIQVGGQTFSVHQEAGACTIVLAPPGANLDSKGGTGSFNVTATPGCQWTATSTAEWITVTFGSPGTGDGVVGYAVPPHSGLSPRSGSINVGGQSFTINQGAGSCSYSLSPGSATVSPSGGSGSFNVNATTGCAWTAISSAAWLVITAGSGTGPGAVNYTAAPNTSADSRSAAVTVATQTFTANQPGACTLVFSPASLVLYSSGGSGTVTVTASSSTCDRSVVNPATWITITSGATGTGSGSFGYTVAANNTGQVRSATLTVGGQAFPVTQESTSCTTLVTPASPSFPATGGTSSLSVISNCDWTATSNSDWISITSGSSGTGNGTIRLAVAANASTQARLGSITIGGQAFNIHQSGVACTVTLTTLRASFPVAGGSGSIQVMAPAECSWTAVSGGPWIVLEGSVSGAGDGSVNYTVAANNQAQPRTATITVANQVYTISQAAASCELAISPSTGSLPSGGGTGSFTVTSNCAWTATTAARWLTLSGASGSGEGTVSFTATANTSSEGRTAAITVGGQTFTVVQSGVSCNVTLAPTSADLSGPGGTGSISVASGTGCKWTPFSQADWIKVTSWSNVSGTGVVHYSADPNPARTARSGTLAVGGQSFTLIQGPAEIVLNAQRIVNAASYAAGPVAPGQILSLFGLFTGPASPATLQLSPDGKFVTSFLAGTRVWFDDVAAPLLYVSDSQVSVVAPFALAGKTSTQVRLEHEGLQSKLVTLKVAPSAPGLFTLNATGSGQGAILNQDYSVNGPSNAAARNSVVMLFATGGGQTDPDSVDGQIAAGPQRVRLPVTVRIGGVTATVLYPGAAPGLVSGALQVNVRVPQGVTVGNAVPVVLRVGDAESPPQVTMAVK